MNLNREIDNFLDIFTEAWSAMDFDTFDNTISWAAYDPLIANTWTKRILQMIDDCQKAGLQSQEIAKLFPTASQLRGMKGFDLWLAGYANVSRREKEKIFAFYFSLLRNYCLEDLYCKSKNIIHTPEETDNITTKLKLATPTIARTLGRTTNACYHLGHAMYSDMHPSIVYDNYGPYRADEKHGEDHILVIKEFNNIKCPELWSETTELSCDSIRIFYIYKDIKMTVDSASHAVYIGDLINNLQYYGLEIDGLKSAPHKLIPIVKELEEIAVAMFQKFQALNFEERKEKYFHMKAYAYRDLHKKLNQDWRPAAEILQEARGKKLYTFDWPPDIDEQRKLIRNTMDPRTDFKI
ncbi:hypothetical protein KJ903_03265 [Patescibacteria group bacterium]|nr:hypothetical protein [Patescibacteria group bacterium]